jgi:hypothetical protein
MNPEKEIAASDMLPLEMNSKRWRGIGVWLSGLAGGTGK